MKPPSYFQQATKVGVHHYLNVTTCPPNLVVYFRPHHIGLETNQQPINNFQPLEKNVYILTDWWVIVGSCYMAKEVVYSVHQLVKLEKVQPKLETETVHLRSKSFVLSSHPFVTFTLKANSPNKFFCCCLFLSCHNTWCWYFESYNFVHIMFHKRLSLIIIYFVIYFS